ncbi:SAUGI family uracil-DNA glycosylase inhibitor [Macrococcus capreoli]|uniref:SAUGI family uracil-DNA glycosylase inhibitor n=1 Tax=Macrococcus capreoli TaxID=2982690 RepID=UPI0021D585F9|nr:SAUGI family uracil-DNA glycosylase inhibitor [Macrococcus sp. TMW 2.2395]MCU7557960.1 SAUGI family uracil-DNA glycosylase inhibitor [Macrococcus sp. TMW 2.2395]
MQKIKNNLTHYVEKIHHLLPQEYLTEFVQLGIQEIALDPNDIPSRLKGTTIDTHTFYSPLLMEENIYSFIASYKGKIILIGYLNDDYQRYFYVNDTKETLFNELHLLNLTEEDILSVNMD